MNGFFTSPLRAKLAVVPRGNRKARPRLELMEQRILLDGALDPSFGNSGVSTIPFDLGGNNSDLVGGVAVQLDGKIVLAGTAQVATTSSDFAVARLNPDGTLDRSFGHGGEDHIPIGSGGFENAFVGAVAMDGQKIVVAGGAQVGAHSTAVAVARLNPDGSLDTSFNHTGMETFSFNLNPNPGGQANALAVEPDGKIVLVGDALSGTNVDFAVARLNPDGSFDTTFNGTGRRTDFPGDATSVAIEPGGTILVGGDATVTISPSQTLTVMALARYTDQGQLDPSLQSYSNVFTNLAGVDTLNLFGESSSVVGLAVDRNDSIRVLGDAFAVLGLSPSGNLIYNDPAVGGTATAGAGLALAPNGNTYVTGTAASLQSVVTRLLPPDLRGDPSFGSSGATTVTFPNETSSKAAAIALEDNGAIVVAGTVTSAGHNDDFGVARLLGSDTSPPTLKTPSAPALDPNFDTGVTGDGITTVTRPQLIGSGADPGRAITLYIGPSDTVFATATVATDGTYAVLATTPLALGTYSITAREGDGQGYLGPRSAAFSLTIATPPSSSNSPPTIAPTLVILTHGQYFDPSPLAKEAEDAAISLLLPGIGVPLLAGQITLNVSNGIPITGSGRNGGEQWQYDMAQEVKNQLEQALSGADTGVHTLVVDWDTYASVSAPAQAVAQRIEQIVSDTEFGKLPWNLLFVGYSRGAIFNNSVIQDLNLPSNPRTGYTEAILLDPTAAVPAGDTFPTGVPAGVAREIVYDDGYAFPVSKIGGNILGLTFGGIPLLAVDSNSARIPGAEYHNEQAQIRTYAESHGHTYTGDNAQDSATSHEQVPYWYYNYLNNPHDQSSTQFDQDLAAFIATIDGGVAPPALAPGQKSQFLDQDPYDAAKNQYVEVISPPSSAPDFTNELHLIESDVKALYDKAVADALQFGKQLVAQAEALAGQVAAQAKQLGNQLVAQAKAAGGEILAAAKQQAKEIEKAAAAEVKRLEAQAKSLANDLYKQGKLFGKGASTEVSAASKQLTAVQKQSQKTINQAQKAADKAVAVVAKKVGDAKVKAEAAAKAAQEKLAAAQAHAQAVAQAAAAQLAVAAAQAKAKAAAAAQNLVNQAQQAGGAISSGFKSAKKKLFG